MFFYEKCLALKSFVDVCFREFLNLGTKKYLAAMITRLSLQPALKKSAALCTTGTIRKQDSRLFSKLFSNKFGEQHTLLIFAARYTITVVLYTETRRCSDEIVEKGIKKFGQDNALRIFAARLATGWFFRLVLYHFNGWKVKKNRKEKLVWKSKGTYLCSPKKSRSSSKNFPLILWILLEK